MQFVAQDVIDLARMLVDDDHEDDPEWLDPDQWLRLFNLEYTELYWRLARMRVVQPALSETSASGPTISVMAKAIAAVGQDMGYYYRVLRNNQARLGAHGLWVPAGAPAAQALEWAATGSGEALTVSLYPRDTATYVVRFAAPLAYLAAATDTTADLPSGVEQRIAYGMARHALTKESGRSGAIEAGILRADAIIGHLASEVIHSDGPRVINSRRRRDAALDLTPVGLFFP